MHATHHTGVLQNNKGTVFLLPEEGDQGLDDGCNGSNRAGALGVSPPFAFFTPPVRGSRPSLTPSVVHVQVNLFCKLGGAEGFDLQDGVPPGIVGLHAGDVPDNHKVTKAQTRPPVRQPIALSSVASAAPDSNGRVPREQAAVDPATQPEGIVLELGRQHRTPLWPTRQRSVPSDRDSVNPPPPLPHLRCQPAAPVQTRAGLGIPLQKAAHRGILLHIVLVDHNTILLGAERGPASGEWPLSGQDTRAKPYRAASVIPSPRSQRR